MFLDSKGKLLAMTKIIRLWWLWLKKKNTVAYRDKEGWSLPEWGNIYNPNLWVSSKPCSQILDWGGSDALAYYSAEWIMAIILFTELVVREPKGNLQAMLDWQFQTL